MPRSWNFRRPSQTTARSFAVRTNRFVLKPVERPREDRPPLVPDNLLMMLEADAQKAVQNFARELRCVPHVRDLQARHQFKSLRPICAGVSGNGGLSVALRSVLHIAGLGGILRVSFGGCLARCRSLLSRRRIQARPVAPLRIELDAVGRIGDHEQRLALAQQPRHSFRAGGIGT